MKPFHKKLAGIVAVICVAILLLLLNVPGTPGAEDVRAASTMADYPDPWQQLELPVIPDGELVWSTNGSLSNGIEFEMVVDRPVETVSAFYEDELNEREFDFYEPEMSGDGAYANGFISGDLEITLDVKPDPKDRKGSSRIRVGIRERNDRVTPTRYSSVAVD